MQREPCCRLLQCASISGYCAPKIRIVQGRLTVECFEIFDADYLFEFTQCLAKRLWRAQVMTSREGMARIDTDANPFLVDNQRDDVSQVFPSRADNIAAPCHVLQYSDDTTRGLVRLVELCCDALDCSVTAVTECGSRMKVVKFDAELLTAVQVV